MTTSGPQKRLIDDAPTDEIRSAYTALRIRLKGIEVEREQIITWSDELNEIERKLLPLVTKLGGELKRRRERARAASIYTNRSEAQRARFAREKAEREQGNG